MAHKDELTWTDIKEMDKKGEELPDKYLLEKVTIQQSEVIENALLQIGEILAVAFLKTNRYDEAMVLNELAGAFCYAAECYGEQTGRLRGDLGVSLAEGTLMKTEAFRKNKLVSPVDNEWHYFVEDGLNTILNEKHRHKV